MLYINHFPNDKVWTPPIRKSLQTTIRNLLKMAKVLQKGRKRCWKRRNCSLRAISPCPTVFSKDFNYRHVKTRACWERVNYFVKQCLKAYLYVTSRFMGEVLRMKHNLPPRKKVVPDPEEPYPSNRIPPVDVDPENVFLCRHVYDLKLKRVLKNPS